MRYPVEPFSASGPLATAARSGAAARAKRARERLRYNPEGDQLLTKLVADGAPLVAISELTDWPAAAVQARMEHLEIAPKTAPLPAATDKRDAPAAPVHHVKADEPPAAPAAAEVRERAEALSDGMAGRPWRPLDLVILRMLVAVHTPEDQIAGAMLDRPLCEIEAKCGELHLPWRAPRQCAAPEAGDAPVPYTPDTMTEPDRTPDASHA